MRKSKIVIISIVLGLSFGSAVQLGMFNAIGNETLTFLHGIFPDNVGTKVDSSGAGNTNGVPSAQYQGAKKVYFDRNLQSQVLSSSFNSLDGGFTTTHQVKMGVPADTYFDFESGVASASTFTTADFFWDASGSTMTINPVNGALVKSVGIVPFNSVDAGLYQSTKLMKNRIKGNPPDWKVANGTVLLWQTAEGNAYKMRIDYFGQTLLITYSSIYYYSIDGNADFLAKATANGWPGDGSATNPIVVQGLTVSSSEFGGFLITNTNLHFVMQNNNFNGLGANVPGFVFDNVTNGVVTGNTVSGYSVGIFVTGSSSNFSFSSNTIQSNSAEGFLVEASSSVSLTGNTIKSNGGSGVLAYQSSGVTVNSNTLNSNSIIVSADPTVLSAGINFVYAYGSVSNNNVTNGYGNGILVFGDNGLTVSSNKVSFNQQTGISVIGSDSITVSLNTIDSNSGAGISVSSSIYTVLANNQVTNNGQDGIHWINSSFGTINGNKVVGNSNPALLSAKPGSANQASLYSGMWMDPSYFNTITNNDFSSNGFGVYLEGSDLNTFSSNSITNNAANGFSVVNSSSNVITINIITGNANPNTVANMLSYLKSDSTVQASLYSGMWMDPSANNTVTDNTITGNYGYGIHLYQSDNNNFDTNSVTGNGFNGIFVESSSYNTINNNDFSSNCVPGLQALYMQAFKPGSVNQASLYSGMWMDPSSHNVVSNNKFDSNYGDGVIVSQSSNNYFTGNQITNNAMNGFSVLSSNGNTINANTITGNANPNLLAELLANSKPGSIDQASLYSGMWMDPSSWNNVFNNIISNNYGNGFFLQSSSNNAVDSNTITGNAANGVYVQNSNYNSITNNDISSNSNPVLQQASYLALNNLKTGSYTQASLYSGMWMDPSTGNYVAGNTVSNNPGYGIWLQSSTNNVFNQNTITNSGTNGFFVQDSSYNNLTYNTITGSGNTAVLDSFLAYAKPGSISQASLYSGMWMDPSVGNLIAYNNISDNNGFGLQSLSSSGNDIMHNDMSFNTVYGFYSVNSTTNTLTDNSFTFNGNYGTYFDSLSSNSNVAHNDFVSNNPSSGNKQGLDNGGNNYAHNFLIDANPNVAYTFAGTSGSSDATPSYTPSTNLNNYKFPPIAVDFNLTSVSLNLDQSGNYMDAHVYFPTGYSAYLTNATTAFAEWNGHYYPMTYYSVQSTTTLHIKFDRMALVNDVYAYFLANGITSATITINFRGEFNGGFMAFYGSDTVNAFY